MIVLVMCCLYLGAQIYISEFPIISSTLDEPVWVREEPKEYNAKESETFLEVASMIVILKLIEAASLI